MVSSCFTRGGTAQNVPGIDRHSDATHESRVIMAMSWEDDDE